MSGQVKLRKIKALTGKVKTITAVDMFCGCGGFTTGLLKTCEELGVEVDLKSINHDLASISTQKMNHVHVEHFCQSVQSLEPTEVIKKGVLDILLAAPECINHSRAKSNKPRCSQSRASARLVLDWLTKLYVKVLVMENVEEFQNWGPLDSKGLPIKSKKGILYQEFLQSLRNLGYTVETKVLNCADYGSRTARRRFFLIASRSRKRARFPEATHAERPFNRIDGKSVEPWRTASEIIDFTLAGNSIFGRKKQLVDKTLQRIFAGLRKFNNLEFVQPDESMLANIKPQTAETLEQPFVVILRNNCDASSVNKPLGTLCSGGGHFGLAQPKIEFEGGAKRDLTGKKLALLSPQYVNSDFLKTSEIGSVIDPGFETYGVKHYEGSDAFSLFKQPLPTITANFAHLYIAKPVVIELVNKKTPKTFHLPGIGEIEIIGLLDVEYRMLTNEENKKAMGFPDDYRFSGNAKIVNKQIGNAVPVEMAQALTREAVKAVI